MSYGKQLREIYACFRCGRYVKPGNGHHVFVRDRNSWSVPNLETGEVVWKERKVRVGPDCVLLMQAEGYTVEGPEPPLVPGMGRPAPCKPQPS